MLRKLALCVFLLTGTVFAFAQQKSVTLDAAIKAAAGDLIKRLPEGAGVEIFKIEAPNDKVSNHISVLLNNRLGDSPKNFRIEVNTAAIQDAEMQKLLSGDYDRESEYISNLFAENKGSPFKIMGSFVPFGNDNETYQMTITAINAETKNLVSASEPQFVVMDTILAGLLGIDWVEPWRTRLFYAGARGGLAMHIFDISRTVGTFSKGDANPNFAFNAAGEFAYQFKNWDRASLSTQLELIFTMGNMNWEYGSDWQKISYTNILIPLLFKPNFYVNKWYFSPFLGGYLSMSWGNYEFFEQGSDIKGSGDVTFDVKGGAVFGGDIGRKVGPGILFLDLRYLVDLGRTRPNILSDDSSMIYGQKKKSTIFTQQMVMLSVGYKFGFGGKK